MTPTDKIKNIIKQTLLEKNGDTGTLMGSIKRWATWILLFLIAAIVLTCLQPSFSLNIPVLHFYFNFEHSDYHIKEYLPTIKAFLAAIGTYIGIGKVADVLTNYHDLKFGPTKPTDPNTEAK